MWGMYVTATLSGGYDADSELQPRNHRADLRTHPSAAAVAVALAALAAPALPARYSQVLTNCRLRMS